MLGMEDLLCELSEDINEQGLPPGFRFHPSDEELITFYLASKVFHGTFCGVDIAEVDLNRCEPWELPDVAKMGEREWYFFSLRDRKYPTGVRTNRATGAGYWKATGKDREIYSSNSSSASPSSRGAGGTALLIGMKKTLVFYKGRAPRGQKTKWVMHEYRLDGDFSYRHTYCKEEWVICRIFHKIGEKKNPVFQGQSYLFEATSSPTTTRGSLPPLLLETASTTAATTVVLESQSYNPMQVALQNHFLIPHDYQDSDDLKSLINPPIVSQHPHAFPINGLQPSFSTITTAPNNNNNKGKDINNPSPSILLKSLLSHQGCTLKEQATIPKQCKTEANFSLFQQPDANLRWVDKIHHYPCHANPFLLGMDCCGGVMGFSSAASPDTTAVAEVSASMASNGAGFQTFLVDPPPTRSVAGESWPSDL